MHLQSLFVHSHEDWKGVECLISYFAVQVGAYKHKCVYSCLTNMADLVIELHNAYNLYLATVDKQVS